MGNVFRVFGVAKLAGVGKIVIYHHILNDTLLTMTLSRWNGKVKIGGKMIQKHTALYK